MEKILWDVIQESFTISERLYGVSNPVSNYHKDMSPIIKEKKKEQKWQRDSEGWHREKKQDRWGFCMEKLKLRLVFVETASACVSG